MRRQPIPQNNPETETIATPRMSDEEFAVIIERYNSNTKGINDSFALLIEQHNKLNEKYNTLKKKVNLHEKQLNMAAEFVDKHFDKHGERIEQLEKEVIELETK